jgi:hypothetical protein
MKLRCAVHWIEVDNNRAELPGRDGRDEKLGYILQDDRNAVASPYAFAGEPACELVTKAVDIGIGQDRVEVEDGRRLPRRRVEEVERGKRAWLQRRGEGRVEARPRRIDRALYIFARFALSVVEVKGACHCYRIGVLLQRYWLTMRGGGGRAQPA